MAKRSKLLEELNDEPNVPLKYTSNTSKYVLQLCTLKKNSTFKTFQNVANVHTEKSSSMLSG